MSWDWYWACFVVIKNATENYIMIPINSRLLNVKVQFVENNKMW